MNLDDDDELADAEFLASLDPKPVEVGPDPIQDPAAFIEWVNGYADARAEELLEETSRRHDEKIRRITLPRKRRNP